MRAQHAEMMLLTLPILASAFALHAKVPLRAPRITCCEDSQGPGDEKRLKAERLALLAERAALEAEKAELEVQQMQMRRGDSIAPPAMPAPASTASGRHVNEPMAMRAPMRYIGGVYPAVALSFPALMTPSQKARLLTGDASASGVTLDFVLDTAANTNTISGQVAGPTSAGGLDLTAVGSITSGVGAGGDVGGGTTYSLGTAELADVPATERVPFISGLSATALPIAAPGAAGVLGVPFLHSFLGGVEFRWGAAPSVGVVEADVVEAADVVAAEAVAAEPTIIFYGDALGTEASRAGLRSVDVITLPGSGLPSVMLLVAGVEVRALLDTGSPITVLNAAAAKAVGLDNVDNVAGDSANPFARFAAGLKKAQAAARGDVLQLATRDGPVQLTRASVGVDLRLGDAIDLARDSRPFVGDLPGLAALNGLGADAGPAAVLGTDILRCLPRMIYTAERIFV